MRIPHKAVVVVADGRKLLLLRNEGDGLAPNLQVEHAEEQSNPSDGEQKTDQAGRAASTRGGGGFAAGGGTMGEVDFHQQEEDRFAADTAAMLKKRALDNDFEKLIIIAPPRTLGELRKHYHKEVSDRLLGELSKDLTGHPIADIEKALTAAE
ncbi:host attachment family protein [Sphingomonas donggukensis]|uniref:Host attachment family protein n=1 Tax=Sphingomonas donggukensis TaxID=2949093 RepID=A0ABY4TVM0_9SPHN|nr:host attachment family protein [Sphingomonas donggukensis]URW76383.1 host attachment family protein [Sphingomonas donggukensis]